MIEPFFSVIPSVGQTARLPSPYHFLPLIWLMYAARPLANQMQSARLIGLASIGRLRPVGLMASGEWVGPEGRGEEERGGGRGDR